MIIPDEKRIAFMNAVIANKLDLIKQYIKETPNILETEGNFAIRWIAGQSKLELLKFFCEELKQKECLNIHDKDNEVLRTLLIKKDWKIIEYILYHFDFNDLLNPIDKSIKDTISDEEINMLTKLNNKVKLEKILPNKHSENRINKNKI